MDSDSRQEQLREQAELGRRLEQIRPILAGYLNDIKKATVLELSSGTVPESRMMELVNRLYVISQVAGNVVNDITAGRIAEQQLRGEAE